MRVVLYDGIQETHVAASLQRALLAAGHEVYNTGRFGSGYLFRDPDELLPVVGPHLDRIAAFRPDLVLVFRPASAPYPVLQALRGTGAVLAAWLSDDPVLFEHSYGPVVDLYDLVLHCGNEEVLRFYERRFGRPTGVNFPFWTDHVAFPAVYGQLEPETTVLFLGNVTGPVRQARYDQLAAMGHPVTVYGRVGADPAGLGGGFLDSEAEVADAARRAQVALNIPQFFRDHRGQRTWFPGLDELGYFDLPSRVIQYAAMGLPTVSVVPGAPHSPAYPELEVRGSIQEADRWVGEVLASGRLPELSSRTLDRFDRSFSAGARVLALESLMRDDGWRSLDAADRTVWFLQFDGRPDVGPVAAPGPAPVVLSETTAETITAEATAVDGTAVGGTEDVVLVHREPLRRFGPTDVVRRELEAWGRLAAGRGPEDGDTRPAPEGSAFSAVLDAPTLLAALGERPVRHLVVADGIGLTADDASVLRGAGIATVCLVTQERLTREDVADFDLVVRVGPVPVDRAALLQGVDHVLETPGVVESAFLQAVRRLDGPQDGQQDGPQDGQHGFTVVRDGEDPATDAVLQGLPGPHRELTGDELAGSGTEDLAAALARPAVYLQPRGSGRRQSHPSVTPYAVCASPTVLTTRHRVIPDQDPWGPWLTKVATSGEASMKLARRASTAAQETPGAPAPLTGLAGMERRRHLLEARRQLADWFDRAAARLNASTTAPDDAGGPAGDRPDAALADGVGSLVHLDRPYPLGPAEAAWADGEYLSCTLWFAGPELVQGLRVLEGEHTAAEVRFPAGSAGAVEVVATGTPDPARGPLRVEVLGDRTHRLHGVARVRVRLQAQRGLRRPETVPSRTLAVFLLPVPAAGVDAVQPRTPDHPRDPGHPRGPDHPGEQDR